MESLYSFHRFFNAHFQTRNMKNIVLLLSVLFLFQQKLTGQINIAAQSQSGIIPGAATDDYWLTPQAPYNERRQLYLDYCDSHQANIGGRQGIFSQIACLEKGIPVNEKIVREAITFVYSTRDCNDFTLGGMLRLLYLNQKKQVLPAQLVNDINQCLLGFKYWWDDPRPDTEYRCYHTENHQGLYHSVELLSGQIFKNEKFADGQPGQEHIAHAKVLLEKWLEHRTRFGFSEWLSNAYYNVDVMTLANLYDFAEDQAIRDRAGLLLDMLMYDMSLNNFQGVFGSTHGRTYAPIIRLVNEDESSNLMKLMFGVGVYNSSVAVGAVSLATSGYRCPEVIEKIATDYSATVRSKQRQSINAEEAGLYGLNYNDELTTHLFWGMQEFIHPNVVDMSRKISEKYNTWPYRDYDRYQAEYKKQKVIHGKVVTPYLDRFALSEANIETYRTPNYMLSSVQAYRPGSVGYQQHIWQATLGVDAVVFTTNPGSREEGVCPNQWAGNAAMPRAAQYKNVLVCIYNTPENIKLPISHAYFPTYLFDEVIEKDSWTFARKGEAYLALYSQNKTVWRYNKTGQKAELEVNSPDNIWLCEMSDRTQWKSFQNFIDQITAKQVLCDGLTVEYDSPSAGKIQFGWESDFKVAGAIQQLTKYPRFNNQYSQVGFTDQQMLITYQDKQLILDFETGKRKDRKK